MSTRERSTAGFTVVELLVVVVIGALVLGAAYQVLAVQERSYRQQGAVMTTQQTIRGALEVLEAELREVSASGGDLVSISPTQVTFRAYRSVGFICGLHQASQEIVVVRPPGSRPFAAGDALFYFIEGNRNTGADDDWSSVGISQVGASPVACDSPWSGTGDVLDVSFFAWGSVVLGAPVRTFEQFTYGLFQIDGEWVLARQGASDPSPIPLIGPLAPNPNGVQFVYLDANGVTTTDPTQVSRVQITVRGRTEGTGMPGKTHYTDELTTQLFLRN